MTRPSSESGTLTRRTLLRTAAGGGAALLATRGLPAWARPVVHAAGVRQPGSLPFPSKPEGTPSMPEIEHIVVLMMENHSFDNILGMLPYRVKGRATVRSLQRWVTGCIFIGLGVATALVGSEKR